MARKAHVDRRFLGYEIFTFIDIREGNVQTGDFGLFGPANPPPRHCSFRGFNESLTRVLNMPF